MPRDPVTKGHIDQSIVYRSFAQYTKNHKLNHVIDIDITKKKVLPAFLSQIKWYEINHAVIINLHDGIEINIAG
jgi:hypothetical protein